MKAFALGGYGAVGLTCAELLAESDLVSEIALAGRSEERAKQAAAEIGDKARAVQVDGADEKQLASLVYLVNLLKRYYHIPRKNIIGHGQVPGASTECPGKRFPWRSFIAQLEGDYK